jgi:hypothetical protein
MVIPSQLFQPLTTEEISQSSSVQGREFRLFTTLLCMLTDYNCRARLTCPNLCKTPSTARRSSADRFRTAFIRCSYLLSLAERKRLRSFLIDSLWYAYLAIQPVGSYLYRQILLDEFDPVTNPTFLLWCAGKPCSHISTATLFLRLVQSESGVLRTDFNSIWSLLSAGSSAQLRAIMWRLVRCGAQSIDLTTRRQQNIYLVKLSHSTCEV